MKRQKMDGIGHRKGNIYRMIKLSALNETGSLEIDSDHFEKQKINMISVDAWTAWEKQKDLEI